MKKLSSWAKENNLSYGTAYNWYKTGKLPIEATQNAGGSIFVLDDKGPQIKEHKTVDYNVKPALIEAVAETRRNRASTIIRTDAYKNISDGLMPLNLDSSGSTSSGISISEAIILCQKAYYNFAVFRNIIDLMTEFTIGDVFFRGGNKKARDFFTALFKKIDLWDLQDRFYREYFRSCNVFIHRMDSILDVKDAEKLLQVYGAEEDVKITGKISLPFQYTILNPADIRSCGYVSYLNATYAKILNSYEVQRLKKPTTDEEKEFFDSLPTEIKKRIKSGESQIVIPLDETKVTPIFYKKQDYEPMSVPLGYPVLKDINWKEELKNIDMAISRTVQQVVLLITVGGELKDGTLLNSQKQIDAINEMFKNESVGRVFVSDFTTKAQFVIPQIAEILDPKKYEIVNKDIQLGLNNILVGEDKFANQQIKTQVFVERLKHARMAFKNKFLIPEIKRISKIMGFKNFPTPYFTAFSLDNKVEWAKIYNRLAEIGILTAEETIQAIEDGKLPTSEESLESQKEYKKYRDDELYNPLIGGQKKEEGRPGGTKAPQTTKKVSPIGASEQLYSACKLKEISVIAAKLDKKLKDNIKIKYSIDSLNDQQKEIVDNLAELIISNEQPNDWIASIDKYIEDPTDKNKEQVESVLKIAQKHNINIYMAGLMYHSKK